MRSTMSVHSFTGILSNSSYISHGQIKFVKSVTCYSWTINNFCICRKKTGEVIDSPVISGGADGEQRWRILLYPKGRSDECKDYLSIFVILLSANESKLDVHAKFSILNDKKEELNERRVEHSLHRGKGTGCSDFLKREIVLDKANGLLPEGNLTILCEIGTGTCPINTAINSSIIHELPITEIRLSDDLEHLLVSEKYSDVILSVHRREFRAHKNILSTRSPAFAHMFDKDTKETEPSSIIEIEDVDPEVLKEMLRFMYTGKVDNLAKLANPLLVAAEKYMLEGLKNMCEEAISKNLTIDNALDSLILADNNKADKLKTQAIGFLIAHAKDIIETPGYKMIAESQEFRLLAEVFRVLAIHH